MISMASFASEARSTLHAPPLKDGGMATCAILYNYIINTVYSRQYKIEFDFYNSPRLLDGIAR